MDTIPSVPTFQDLSKLNDSQLTQLFGVRDYFVYEADFSGVASGATSQTTFTIQTDSNFLWQTGCYIADIAAAGETDSSRVIPLMTCIIQDTSSGRQLSSTPVPIPSQFGTGELPFVLPSPRFFRANTQITVSVTNYDAANAYNLRLSFIGTKFYKFAQQI